MLLKNISLLAIVAISFAACKQEKKQASTDTPTEKTAVSYEGIYKGTLPCADCEGIEVALTLGKDQKATYLTNYLGKADGRFTERGTYEIKDGILILKTDQETLQFAVSENKISLLGQDGKPAEGKLAPYYDLKKMKLGFDYEGTYALFYEETKGYQQFLTITSEGENYKVHFTASKVKDRENCSFTQIGQVQNDTLFVNLGDPHKGVVMTINPTHDQLGVEVFTKNFDDRLALMYYCGGGGSLAGDYLKNQITADGIGAFSRQNTIADVVREVPEAQLEKAQGEGEFADDVYDDYKIYTRDVKPLLIVTPKKADDKTQKINRVLVLSPFFKTAKGIHCQSTFGEIQKAYTISKIEPTENHIVLTINEINASFSISKKHLPKDWWNETTKTVRQDKIPAEARAESLVLWWEE